jgi:hypothetical protein
MVSISAIRFIFHGINKRCCWWYYKKEKMLLGWLHHCFGGGDSDGIHVHYDGPPEPPPTEAQCWTAIMEVNSESQYRYSLGQGSTLNDQKNRITEAIYTLVRYHGMSLDALNEELRHRRLSLIWLYAVAHPGSTDPECSTTCRDALTHETRTHSIGVFLGPESEYILVRQATRGSPSLSECGFLELK